MYLGNTYKNFPALYDLLYQRYLKSVPDFVSLVKINTPKSGLILDLAAGTGEVTIPLLQNGFKVVSLDSSNGMLRELKRKAKKIGVKNYSVKCFDMRKINYKEKFDSVCIRQAINYYLGTKSLSMGLNRIYSSLKQGGNFIFNTPKYQGEINYPTISNYYEKGAQKAFVVEANRMNNRLLKHNQYSIVWENSNEPNFVADENSFYMFTKKEFEHALKTSGFSKIKFGDSNKTLYCVATK